MLPRSLPPLDPMAHRAAIDALEAQRAAYRRYARTVDGQREALSDGDGDRALAAVSRVAEGTQELEAGARRLQPLLDAARGRGSADERRTLDRHLDALTREAQAAEAAVHNMTAQLEAWRAAYGRELADAGVTPGTDAGPESDPLAAGVDVGVGAAAGGVASPPRAGVYGRRPRAGTGPHPPSLIDRRG